LGRNIEEIFGFWFVTVIFEFKIDETFLTEMSNFKFLPIPSFSSPSKTLHIQFSSLGDLMVISHGMFSRN
jgi:hypothetical protein